MLYFKRSRWTESPSESPSEIIYSRAYKSFGPKPQVLNALLGLSKGREYHSFNLLTIYCKELVFSAYDVASFLQYMIVRNSVTQLVLKFKMGP